MGRCSELGSLAKKSPPISLTCFHTKSPVKLLPNAKKALVSIEAGGGAGSGVIVSEDGLVLTAAHVIGQTGKSMMVRLPNGRRASAKALGGSEISDAAMLQITDDGPGLCSHGYKGKVTNWRLVFGLVTRVVLIRKRNRSSAGKLFPKK